MAKNANIYCTYPIFKIMTNQKKKRDISILLYD